jgi:hypothetical protein
VATHGTDTTLLEPLNARLAQLAAQSLRAAGAARVCAERLGRAHAELHASERREREAREQCTALSVELERSSHALQVISSRRAHPRGSQAGRPAFRWHGTAWLAEGRHGRR